MKRFLILLPLLLLLVGVAAPTMQAQTVLNDSLHPGTYGWAVRSPWNNNMCAARIAHSAATATNDTIEIDDLAATDKVLFTRHDLPTKAGSIPEITVAAGEVIIAFGVADTVTYSLVAIKQ